MHHSFHHTFFKTFEGVSPQGFSSQGNDPRGIDSTWHWIHRRFILGSLIPGVFIPGALISRTIDPTGHWSQGYWSHGAYILGQFIPGGIPLECNSLGINTPLDQCSLLKPHRIKAHWMKASFTYKCLFTGCFSEDCDYIYTEAREHLVLTWSL